MDESKEIKDIQELLQKVNGIVETDRKIQEERRKRGEKFNVFNVIGLWSEEVRLHSAFLAELLNPNGQHGMKDEFLKSFIKQANLSDLGIDTMNCQVDTEYYIGPVTDTTGGRIDILIHFHSDSEKKAIIIENKIYAGDQWNQLLRYHNFGESHYKDKENGYRLLYLTLDGHDASDDSTGKKKDDKSDKEPGFEYNRLSYKEDILSWLEECAKIAYNQPLVRETIKQYQTLVKQLTNQDMETKSKEDILNLLMQDSNFESVVNILNVFCSKTDFYKRCIQSRLVPQLKVVAEQLSKQFSLNIQFSSKEETINEELKFDYQSYHTQIDCYFFFRIQGNKEQIIIIKYRFANWNLRDLQWGISKNNININDKLDCFTELGNKYFKCGWSYVDKYYRCWDTPETFKKVIQEEGGFANEVKNDIGSLLQELIKKFIII